MNKASYGIVFTYIMELESCIDRLKGLCHSVCYKQFHGLNK